MLFDSLDAAALLPQVFAEDGLLEPQELEEELPSFNFLPHDESLFASLFPQVLAATFKLFLHELLLDQFDDELGLLWLLLLVYASLLYDFLLAEWDLSDDLSLGRSLDLDLPLDLSLDDSLDRSLEASLDLDLSLEFALEFSLELDL